MSRDLGTENTAQVIADTVRPIVLCEIAFQDGYVRTHSGIGTISWDSKSWLGVGDFGGVSDIEEGEDIAARTVELTLSGIPSSLLDKVTAANFRGRAVKLWLAFRTEAGAFVSTPYQAFGGKIDTATIAMGGEESTISVNCENRLIDLRKARTSRYTHEEQIARFPGDLGLAFVARLAEKPLYWGVPNAKSEGTQSTPRFYRVSGA